MKKYITGFKNSVKYAVSIIASREFAFIYCLVGTIAQVSHTYFLINNISSLDGGWKMAQALMISIFISSSLLYFTAISDNAETKESRKIHMAVTLFTIIEILINMYYYSRHLLIDNLPELNGGGITINYIFDFVFAIIISCLIPITIKLYSSHIRAKEWLEDVFGDEKQSEILDEIAINEKIVEYMDPKINELTGILEDFKQESLDRWNDFSSSIPKSTSNIDVDEIKQELSKTTDELLTKVKSEISETYKSEADLFFKQFQNKLRKEANQ